MAAFSSSQITANNSSAKGGIMNKIHARLVALNLEGITTRWAITRQPWLSLVAEGLGTHASPVYPCGVISPFDEDLTEVNTLLGLNRTTFKYVIAVARSSTFDLQTDMHLMMEWDQAIRRSFRNTHATDLNPGGGLVTRMGICSVIQAGSFIDEAFRKGVDGAFYIVGIEADEAFG